MSRHTISLKTRVRYEGRARIIDRRPNQGVEKLPNPLWYMIGQSLGGKFHKPATKSKVSTYKKAA